MNLLMYSLACTLESVQDVLFKSGIKPLKYGSEEMVLDSLDALSSWVLFDQSIASTKTKYIKLNTKTQFFFQ